MKNLQLIFLCGLLLILSCQQETSNKEEQVSTNFEQREIDKKKSLYRFPLKKAKKDINRYDSLSKLVFKNPGYVNKIPIKAFTIRAIDLLEVLGLPDNTVTSYDHVRVYLAMNDSLDFKLFLTPVDSANLSAKPPRAGVDVILSGKYDGQDLGSEGAYLLDFSAPCPTTCPGDPE
jgi:hypothetical protein